MSIKSGELQFYILVEGPVMVLLHAYKKQSQKAPKREIDLAKNRMKQVLSFAKAAGGGR